MGRAICSIGYLRNPYILYFPAHCSIVPSNNLQYFKLFRRLLFDVIPSTHDGLQPLSELELRREPSYLQNMDESVNILYLYIPPKSEANSSDFLKRAALDVPSRRIISNPIRQQTPGHVWVRSHWDHSSPRERVAVALANPPCMYR